MRYFKGVEDKKMKKLAIFFVQCIVFTIMIYTQTVKLELIKKIDTETTNYIITPSQDILKTDGKRIYILSVKEKKFFVLSKDGEYKGVYFKKGEGPCGLKYAYDFFLLPDKKIVFFNSSKEFKFFKLKTVNCFSKKVVHNIYMPVQIKLIEKDKYLVLKSIPVVSGDDGSYKYLFYFYDIKQNKTINMFYEFNVKDESRLKYIRGEFGKGNFVVSQKKIFLVFDQPGFIRIFNTNGRFFAKIKSEFPFLKRNKASVVKKQQGDYLITRIKSDEKCKMKLIELNNKVYLIIRNNDLKRGEIDFYFGEVDIKTKVVRNIIKFDFGDPRERILYYKSNYKNLLIFGNDDFIYIYSISL